MSKDYHIERDPALPGFNRFFSDTPTFPISVSYPQALHVDFDLYQDRCLALRFGDDFAITRWDLAEISPDYAPFIRGDKDIFWYIKQDMKRMKSASEEVLRPIKYWIDMAQGIIGELETSVPRARWKNCNDQFGEKIYFQRRSEPNSIVWAVIRHTSAGISEENFRTALRSFRWLRF